jgi:hypothetical protein
MLRRAITIAGTLFVLLFSGNVSAQESCSPRLLHNANGSARSIVVWVSDSSRFFQWIERYFPHTAIETDARVRGVYRFPRMSSAQVKKISVAPGVKFADVGERIAVPDGFVSGLDLTINAVTTAHHDFPSVNGYGLKVSVKENPFDKNDLDLHGRVNGYDTMPGDFDPHATAMATIISGAGNLSPETKGVAWRSTVSYADFSDLMPDVTTSLISQGITVQNHSYGVGIENYYGIESHAFDKQCVDYAQMVHVFSVGNSGLGSANSGPYNGIEGYANITGQFKISKNSISVGGVNREGIIEPQSSRGPSSDGRIKPEVVAYGIDGTSEAAAIVSGICILSQQLFLNLYDSLPASDLVKAAIINAADDADSPGIDYASGFGIADAEGTLATISDKHFIIGSVSQSNSRSFVIDVPEGVHELKITLAWTDAPANPGAATALVNDLDLEVADPLSSAAYRPWVLSSYPHADSLKKAAHRAPDHINNVEQVTILDPDEGAHTISVSGYRVLSENQSFSIAYEFASGLQWIYPTASDAVEADKDIFLRWKWSGPDAVAYLEWKPAEAGTWSTLAHVSVAQEFFLWKTPAVNNLIEVRLVVGAETLSVQQFVVSQQPDMSVGYNCDKDAMLFWPRETDSEYQVYKLTGDYFVEDITLSDTVYLVDKDEEAIEYFAVAPRIGGRAGVRSVAISPAVGFETCYINSFLPRELVSDSVIFDLVLGTTFGLRSMVLERESSAGFVDIKSFSSVDQVSYVLGDRAPVPGRNRYRLRLDRSNNETVYSQLEEVWYTRAQDLLLFPNPAIVGELLNVVLENDPVILRIYDAAGQLMWERWEDGEIKMIDTSGMSPGIFIVRISTLSGKVLTGKIILR